MSELKKTLVDYILKNKEYLNADGTLNKYKLLTDIDEIKPELVDFLSKTKDKSVYDLVFKKVKDITILNQNILIKIINSKDYIKNSTTFYDNKIELSNKFNNNVVLNFPFKDCTLVGGMNKEDEKNRTEVFYNELLDKEKIDNLFSPKIFTKVENIGSENKNLNISNLIIKGNNLIVLHSLLKKYKESVGIIYIDPPYYFLENKDSDTFSYNSNFKLSSWLTFMKNRIEIAHKMLSSDGLIFVSIGEDGLEYSKFLLNEIFGSENFISNMPRKTVSHMRTTADYQVQNINDYVLVYAKNKLNVVLNKKITGEKTYEFKDSQGEYQLKPLQNSGENGTRKARPNLYYPIFYNTNTKEFSLDRTNKDDIEIYPKKVKGEDGRWLWSREKFLKDKNILTYEKKFIWKKEYYSEQLDQNKYQAEQNWLDSFPNRLGASSLSKLKLDGEFTYSKPVELIKHLIKLGSKKDAIVLDFFAGSGTTAQAVLDLNKEDGGNRKFILIEQMDYAKGVTAERIKRFIEKENLNESFIYCELLKESIREDIVMCKNTDDLIKLVNIKFKDGYFQYVSSKEDLISVLKKEKNVNEMKKVLIENYFDNNREYIPYSDIKTVKVDKKDLEFNKKFYGDRNE